MAIVTVAVSSSSLMPTRALFRESKAATTKKVWQGVRVVGNFSHFGDTVRKDFEFIKKGINNGMDWANEAFRIPQVSKTLDDILWLRNLEDHNSPPIEPQSWPQPSYPGLTGLDLLMADLKALESYASYFYCLSKIWSKPLPEAYDPQQVSDYFNCRPHLVAFRLLEVFTAFATATIRIRATGMRKLLRSKTMLNLGPTFIKVGQSLSTRPDIIGSEITKALSGLHDQIPPFPRTLAMKIVEEELGSPVESFFSYVSEEPVAAASFGQVYRGSTHDGRIVALKVQRPNLYHVVVRDIYILRLGLGLLQKIAKRKSDLRLYADELGKGLVGELDYSIEAANASKFLDAHSSFSFMYAPKIFPDLSRKRVLTMEWVVGDSPTDLLSLSTSSTCSERQKLEAKRRLLDLVSKGIEASLVQLLETGLLHADPHPGNLRYISSGQIGFLDFGLLCQMEKKHRFAMLAAIVHIVNGDWASLMHSLIDMDVVKPGTNIRRITMELENSLGEVEFKDGIPDVKFSRVLGKILSVAIKNHFRMPPYFHPCASFSCIPRRCSVTHSKFLALTLAQDGVFSLAVAADPNFKTFEAAYPYVVQKLLTENSAETRKILHLVVLNKQKEFRWERLALFLRVGSTRKTFNRVIASKNESSLDYLPNSFSGIFDTAYLVLRLLPSRDGIVLRKLLMTANGASLIRAMVSKEAIFVRQQLCRVIADVLYQWMTQTFGRGIMATQYSSQVRWTSEADNRELSPSSRLSVPVYDYQSIFRDRRLKVIFSRILDSARKDPALMLKFYWTAFAMVVTGSVRACHRVLVSLAKATLAPSSLLPRVAISA
ncbi:PROTEIN KINASE SUPERFAMILY PROTEIN [Salix koriyanagi]|uniref:PROTEIN KINASE SUPERFAMILY PROTEIN n=1 Tax=Salix koriyanagi TaxID=2511006 RepID=A0A9Q1AIV6_9ROSI|nr:PROTEIN KINASE SUPERFAMILY PROTEIN [Salix koriyanagi]